MFSRTVPSNRGGPAAGSRSRPKLPRCPGEGALAVEEDAAGRRRQRPTSSRASVDLPAPEGPTTPSSSPASTRKETLRRSGRPGPAARSPPGRRRAPPARRSPERASGRWRRAPARRGSRPARRRRRATAASRRSAARTAAAAARQHRGRDDGAAGCLALDDQHGAGADDGDLQPDPQRPWRRRTAPSRRPGRARCCRAPPPGPPPALRDGRQHAHGAITSALRIAARPRPGRPAVGLARAPAGGRQHLGRDRHQGQIRSARPARSSRRPDEQEQDARNSGATGEVDRQRDCAAGDELAQVAEVAHRAGRRPRPVPRARSRPPPRRPAGRAGGDARRRGS